MTAQPLIGEQLAAIRAEIRAALSEAGAYCGECGFEPGEVGCPDCVRVREMYADAVMPVIDQLHADLAHERRRVTYWQECRDNYAAENRKLLGQRRELRAQVAAARAAAHIADADDVTDWQRGYRSCSTNVLAALDRAADSTTT